MNTLTRARSQTTSFEKTKTRFLNAALEALRSGEIGRLDCIKHLVHVGNMKLNEAYNLTLQYKPKPETLIALEKKIEALDGERGVLVPLFEDVITNYGDEM